MVVLLFEGLTDTMKPDREEHGMELEPNPWDDVPWQQRDIPPELRAIGVEKDVMGSTVQVVQVRMPGAPRNYTYQWWNLTMLEDHDGEPDWLAKGDWVALPANVASPDGSKGVVTGFGRSGYSGPLKDVARRLPPQDPWTAQMEAVRTRTEALKVWRAARSRGVVGEALEALQAVGTAALEKAGRS